MLLLNQDHQNKSDFITLQLLFFSRFYAPPKFSYSLRLKTLALLLYKIFFYLKKRNDINAKRALLIEQKEIAIKKFDDAKPRWIKDTTKWRSELIRLILHSSDAIKVD